MKVKETRGEERGEGPRTLRRHQDLPHGDIIFKKHENSILKLKKNYNSEDEKKFLYTFVTFQFLL